MAKKTTTRRARRGPAAEEAIAEEAVASGAAQAEEGGGPVVYRTKKKKKRKKARYTKGTKDAQRFIHGLGNATERSARAVSIGLRDYRRRAKRSRRKGKRDAEIRDFWKNSARGLEKGFREWGKAPWDLAKEIRGRRVWKNTRPAVRFLAYPFYGFFR